MGQAERYEDDAGLDRLIESLDEVVDELGDHDVRRQILAEAYVRRAACCNDPWVANRYRRAAHSVRHSLSKQLMPREGEASAVYDVRDWEYEVVASQWGAGSLPDEPTRVYPALAKQGGDRSYSPRRAQSEMEVTVEWFDSIEIDLDSVCQPLDRAFEAPRRPACASAVEAGPLRSGAPPLVFRRVPPEMAPPPPRPNGIHTPPMILQIALFACLSALTALATAAALNTWG